MTVSTIHAAKGAEFDTVFVIGLEEGVLPDERALGDPAALAAERAVAYVALTRARARRRLYLSHCAGRWRGGAFRPTTRSRFVTHLPAGPHPANDLHQEDETP